MTRDVLKILAQIQFLAEKLCDWLIHTCRTYRYPGMDVTYMSPWPRTFVSRIWGIQKRRLGVEVKGGVEVGVMMGECRVGM